MADAQLKANLRQITGRKVKQLRAQGLVPGNVFGKNVDSVSVQVNQREFQKTFDQVGETGLVELLIDGQTARPVLINEVEYNPVDESLTHINFRQVNLKEKITTFVPVELIGESAAVKEQGAVLVQSLDEVEIEALPTDIPDAFQVDVSALVQIGDVITAGNLKLGEGVELITDLETVLVLAQEVKEEVEETGEEQIQEEAETTVQKSGDEAAPAATEEKK